MLLCTALGGVVGGISAGPSNALNADSMPCDADGAPRNAGRDTMLLATVAQLSGAIIPPVLGHLFGLFHQKRQAYRAFFFAAAGLHAISVTLLFLVDPVGERLRQQQKRLREREQQQVAAATAPGTAVVAAPDAGTTLRAPRRQRRLSTPMFPGDGSQPTAVAGPGCCSRCSDAQLLGAAASTMALVGVATALMGAVCVREAVVFGIRRGGGEGGGGAPPTNSSSATTLLLSSYSGGAFDSRTASDGSQGADGSAAGGADAVGLRLCGEASAELVPSDRSVAAWHHGLLLGLLLLGCGAAMATCAAGIACECRWRRARRVRLALQRVGGEEFERDERAAQSVKPD